MTQQQTTGDAGEALVCQYLEAKGWRILATQWRCRWGELDIVARQDPVLAFVEVKTRQGQGWDQAGRLAVDGRKQQKLIRTATTFLAHFPDCAELECRFDVALVQHRSGSDPSLWLADYIMAAFEL